MLKHHISSFTEETNEIILKDFKLIIRIWQEVVIAEIVMVEESRIQNLLVKFVKKKQYSSC